MPARPQEILQFLFSYSKNFDASEAKENEKNERVLSDDQIDELYHLLADESIELEKNS